MFDLRQVFAFWAAVFVLVAGGQAQAQTTPVIATSVLLNKNGVTHTASRSGYRVNTIINEADCTSDDIVTFPLTLAGQSTYTLQVWVGTSCADPTVRTSTTQNQCWLLYSAAPSGGTTANTPSIQLHVRNMLAGYTLCNASADTGTAGATSTAGTGGDTTGGSSGTAGTGGTGGDTTGGGGATSTPSSTQNCPAIGSQVNVGPEACVSPTSSVAGGASLTLYFMLVDPTSFAVQGTSDTWVGSFKLVGPPAPDVVSAGVGGNLLVVNFSYSTQPADQTGNGYYLYCDPPPGTAAAVDGGFIQPDAGSGTALACGAPTSQVLLPGMVPPADSRYRCGTGQKTTQTANATSLVDGVVYNVAVAAFDTFENVGPLSTLQCAVPQPITGFYKAYRDAGGTGGGGFCSFSTKREPVIFLAILGVASVLVFRRRRAA